MSDTINILVLCTGNSCRSQMAHGFLRHYFGERATIYSAGVETHGLNPKAVAVMAEAGIDIAHYTSNHVDEYAGVKFQHVITVCDSASERCPHFPSTAQRHHQNFPDPAKATGTEAEVLEQFRLVRESIKVWCQAFAHQY